MIQEEIFPLVDKEGTIIGQATRSECHSGTMLLHPVIHLHLFNSEGELFLQKRSPNKDIQPNKWDSSVGGHIDLGETPEQSAIREASEELGVTVSEIHYIDKHIIRTDREQELTYVFWAIYDGKIQIDGNEVSDGRYWSMSEIETKLNQDVFTPNFELDFVKYLMELLPRK